MKINQLEEIHINNKDKKRKPIFFLRIRNFCCNEMFNVPKTISSGRKQL